MKVWLNGRIVDETRALVRATDKGVLCGWGVFEVVRAYGGEPFRIDDHLARLRRSAKRFGVRLPRADFAGAIRRLCRANRLGDAYVRLTFTHGGAALIMAMPLPPRPSSSRVRIAPWVHDPRAPLHGHKTLNYLENYLVRNETREDGFAETLFTDLEGNILEGTVTNLFLVKRDVLITPGLEGVLPGVTRKVVFEIANRLGIRVKQRSVRPADLRSADEAFLTNALIEVLPLKPAGGGAVTRRIRDAYAALVSREATPRQGRR